LQANDVYRSEILYHFQIISIAGRIKLQGEIIQISF